MSTWSEAFVAHLNKLKITQHEALFVLRRARIRATPSQISYWCRGARAREGTRHKIARWSNGAVPANLPAASASGPSLEDASLHARAG